MWSRAGNKLEEGIVTQNRKRISFKRWNPLLGEWVIIAPATAVRPWQSALISPTEHSLPEYDNNCYLCPGVERAGGQVNPNYTGVYIFENDFPALSMSYTIAAEERCHSLDLPAHGICRVISFSPKHNIPLPEMESAEITHLLNVFQREYRELSAIPEIKNVLIFENKGEVIGVSNLHPHGQIYATDFVPRIQLTEYYNMRQYLDRKGSCLLCGIVEEELNCQQRIISRNSHFVSYVPYFARHVYEVHIVPVRHVTSITGLTEEESDALAAIYHEVLIRYDNLFQMPFPNITLFHSAPSDEKLDPAPYHFHIEFCPPLRSNNKVKYMAGFETGGGNIINPSLPGESAELLRSVSDIHYSKTIG